MRLSTPDGNSRGDSGYRNNKFLDTCCAVHKDAGVRKSTKPLIDRLLGGNLDARLTESRQANKSYEAIARELAADGIDVTGETVRRWCAELKQAS